MLPTVVTYHLERPHDAATASDVLAAIRAQVLVADRLGYAGAWFAEHHFGSHRSVMPSPLLLAVSLAAQTERLRVGTSVICLPLHHPVSVAEDIAVADLLTGGRLDIGFGSGSAGADFAVFGADQANRHAQFEEQLAILLRCWSGQRFSYEGSIYRLPGMTAVPSPLQAPAEIVWLAASSAPTAQLAGRLGFGLQLPRGRPAPAYVPIIAAYREAWRGAGHGGPPRVSIARCLYVGSDDEEALATVEAATQRFARRWSPATAEATTGRELVDQLHFCVGGAETVLAHLRDLSATTGLTHLSMQPTWEHLPQEATLASLRRYAEQVAPRL